MYMLEGTDRHFIGTLYVPFLYEELHEHGDHWPNNKIISVHIPKQDDQYIRSRKKLFIMFGLNNRFE